MVAKRKSGDSRLEPEIRWTEEARSKVMPRRKGSIVCSPPSPNPGAAQELASHWEEYRGYWVAGEYRCDATRRKLVDQVTAELDQQRIPVEQGTAAALLAMLDYRSRRRFNRDVYGMLDELFLTEWIRAGGLPLALQVLTACYQSTGEGAEGPSGHEMWLVPGSGWWCLESGILGPFVPLRRHVVAAAPKAYEQARAVASKLRSNAPIWLRCAIDFSFPDEEQWSAEDAQTAIKQAGKKRLPPWTWPLFATVMDEAVLERLVPAILKDDDPWMTGTQDFGYTVIEHLGPRAFGLLRPLVEKSRTAAAKTAHAEALSIIQSDEAAAFFSAMVDDKRLRNIAKGYMERGRG